MDFSVHPRYPQVPLGSAVEAGVKDPADVFRKNNPWQGFHHKPHLHPFMPYFEKTPSSHSYERRASNEPHAISIDTIRTWIATCDRFHVNHCHQSAPQRHTQGRPLWLIDVLRHCIARAAPEHQYLALTYVWGSVESASATRGNIEALQMPNSLARLSLPRTIRDAMRVTALLGYRFLWVDRLCIVQDDVVNKNSQIRDMGGIYAKSVLTIVAAQGTDAESPLHGGWLETQRADTLSGFRDLCVVDSTSGTSLGVADGPPCTADMVERESAAPSTFSQQHNDIMLDQMALCFKSHWSSRGWTFQEYLFSPRRLVFQNNTVNWDCHCSSWHENQRHITALACSLPPSHLVLNRTPWPEFARYARLVSLFAWRDFKYPQDVLDACASILVNLAPVFYGGFISGLPRAFFHEALLWRPWSQTWRRSPRKMQGESEEGGAAPAVLPSWSWAGWHGDVHSEVWSLLADTGPITPGSESNVRELTSSAPTWHAEDKAGPWLEVQTIRDLIHQAGFPGPADAQFLGWVRSKGQHGGSYKFSHPSLRPAVFRRPFPVRPHVEMPGPSLLRPRYLRIRTTAARLYVGGPFPCETHWTFADSKSAPPRNAVLSLHEHPRPGDGPVVGYVVLNDQDTGGKVPAHLPGGVASFETPSGLNFIEMSRSMRREGGHVEEHVNVLWAEAQEGGDVLYRCGVGLVFLRFWVLMAHREVDAILG
jgi:hypothetical protein